MLARDVPLETNVTARHTIVSLFRYTSQRRDPGAQAALQEGSSFRASRELFMQESSLHPSRADRPIVIEVGGEPLGVVIRQDHGYRFLAVKLPAFAVDGHQFDSVEKAHLAVSEAVRKSAAA
jgi:hypothetical protein